MKNDRTEQHAEDYVAQMVARFQKSRVDADEADSAQGKRDAAAWVRERASYRDMRALEAVADDFWLNLEQDDQPGFELADALIIELESRYGEETAREAMLAAMFPSKGLCNSKVYLSGFVVEATALWDEVKARVVARGRNRGLRWTQSAVGPIG